MHKHSIKHWKINIAFIYNPVDFILHVHSITYLPFYSIQMSEEENVFSFCAIVGCEYTQCFNLPCRMGKTCFKGFSYFSFKETETKKFDKNSNSIVLYQPCTSYIM